MGCDIHLHIEVKINGVWHHYGAPNVARDYKLFERIAGVRGKVEKAISAPRGMPSDATVLTQFDNERGGCDWHSHSWLGAREIALLEDWLFENVKRSDLEHYILHSYLFGNSFAAVHQYPTRREKGVEDVRFVFWFDN